MGIVWLASYPKSGNTWVRFLLYNAIYGQPKESLDIARKIPDIHRPIPFDPPTTDRLLCKTHFAYSEKHPKITQTEKAVLIIRDPRDVLFSALNYRRLAGMTQDQMSDEMYAKRFITSLGDSEFQSIGFGNWKSHIESWQRNNSFPVLTVKYEDLKSNTSESLKAMIDFIGLDIDEDRITQAVKSSSFDSMRAMEIREKHQSPKKAGSANKPKSLFVGTQGARQSKTYFMNTGKSGQSLASISPSLESAFRDAFAQPMSENGYFFE
ncbi:MAG: sulfotransferase domain-containing protein [Phycisphaerales bacterium]|nr:sulfotransferase domain-containing protein [Phycisphaerales bacterium]